MLCELETGAERTLDFFPGDGDEDQVNDYAEGEPAGDGESHLVLGPAALQEDEEEYGHPRRPHHLGQSADDGAVMAFGREARPHSDPAEGLEIQEQHEDATHKYPGENGFFFRAHVERLCADEHGGHHGKVDNAQDGDWDGETRAQSGPVAGENIAE